MAHNSIPRRRDPAAWPADFGQGRWHDTYPTQPAELQQSEGLHRVNTEAASCCSGITSRSDADDKPGQGAGVLLVPACVALSLVSLWALVAWLAKGPM